MNTGNYSEPTDQEISTTAYYLWEADGRPEGKDQEYWFQARERLRSKRGGKTPPPNVATARSATPPDAGSTAETKKSPGAPRKGPAARPASQPSAVR